jgi:hypothetical protein
MANYRVVTIDKSGKLGRHRGFICDNDGDAIVWAKQLLDDDTVELWSGPRLVTRLEPQLSEKTSPSNSRRNAWGHSTFRSSHGTSGA